MRISYIMRLLSTKDFTFHVFPEDQVPTYAILSHTWDGNEVTLQDMQQPNARRILQSSNPPTKSWMKFPQSSNPPTKSWKKIQDACLKAGLKGFLYIWIDSCCIDKTNSAELQEAINSMFRWYRNSAMCLALLSDVSKSDFELNEELRNYATLSCRWFTRGWTLQELLAPVKLLFFDVNWRELGSRSEWGGHISEATGIHPKFLLGIELDPYKKWDLEAVLRDTSAATKMSWAAGRKTTRIEDQAYCLLGLFDIHMPMLYGEGTKAFARLQQEIMKSTDDCTLLAWGYNEPLLGAPISEIPFLCRCCCCGQFHRDDNRTSSDTLASDLPSNPMPLRSPHLPSCAYADVTSGTQRGVVVGGQLRRDLNGHNAGGRPRSLLAASPRDFRFAGDLEPCGIPGHKRKRPTFAMSQRGLEMSLPIVQDESHHHISYGLLACSPTSKTKRPDLVAIPLIRSSVIDKALIDDDDEYTQSPFCLPCKVPDSFAERAKRMSICIRNEDRYRRVWDSAAYLETTLILDFGHPLATRRGGGTLCLELMYPAQPLYSIYYTLFRHSCPRTTTPCAPLDTLMPDWWKCHLPRPPLRSHVPDMFHPWNKSIRKIVNPAPNTTIAAVVLNFDQFPLTAEIRSQTRILLVVSSDPCCRVKKLGDHEEVTLQSLMTIFEKPEMVGPELKFEKMGVEEHEWWRERLVVCKLPDGIELCMRMWY